MKQLTCEMCGSTDLTKQDGVFVCQSCGCKYSVEEAKKMMVEGTVDVAGTVKVDDTERIDNYYRIAENAYIAGNNQEAEIYCNKIIEIDAENYKAWFLKGQTAGWQSTLDNLRIEESVHCFTKAIDYAPEDEVSIIKEKAAEEISNLSIALISVSCDNFDKFPSDETRDALVKNLTLYDKYSVLLLNKCGARTTDYRKEVANMITSAVINAHENIVKQRGSLPDVSKWKWFNHQSMTCVVILQKAIEFTEDDDKEDVIRYKMIILILQQLLKSKAYDIYGGCCGKLTGEAKKQCNELIMETKERIKEIDPSYENSEPAKKESEGCYVATAVYGSYDCPQVWTLRRFRDDTLAKTWYGRVFIRTYYAISPTLVKWFGHTEWFKKMWKGKLDRMVANLNADGVENTPYEDKMW